MALGRRREKFQQELMVPTSALPRSPGHPFYTALNKLLAEANFDSYGNWYCPDWLWKIALACAAAVEAEASRGIGSSYGARGVRKLERRRWRVSRVVSENSNDVDGVSRGDV